MLLGGVVTKLFYFVPGWCLFAAQTRDKGVNTPFLFVVLMPLCT